MRVLSTVAFAQLAASRQQTDPSAPQKGPGKYADILAAIIPAEVIAAHAFIVSSATEVKSVTIAGKPEQVTDVTDPAALKVAFFGLVLASIVLYAMTKLSTSARWHAWDYVRMMIPPTAFVAWTLVTEPSAFDGFDQGDLNDTTQIAVGVVAAVILGAVAKLCQDKADAATPTPPPPAAP